MEFSQQEFDKKVIETAIRLIKQNNDPDILFKGYFTKLFEGPFLTFRKNKNDTITAELICGYKGYSSTFPKSALANVL